MKRELLFTALASGLIGNAVPAAAQQDAEGHRPPNIVFVLADDLGYGDLGCYGQRRFETPHIDSLARAGMRFTQAYAGTTVSAPSRASLLTGLHSGHAPIRGNFEVEPEGQASLPADVPNLFTLFQRAGYVTGVFGKWGLGAPGAPGAPGNQGVDCFFGYNCQRLAHNYYPGHLWDNDSLVALPGNAEGAFGVYAQDLIQQRALEFIDRHRDSAFFLFLPYVLPHAELIVPEDSIIARLRGRYPETPYRGCDAGPAFRRGGYCSQPEPRATFAAMVTRLDLYVGQVVEKLRGLGLLDNTLVIFASDNGPHREGGADPDFFDSNGPFRGYKRDLYEGGVRVPLIAFWPGVVAPGETDHICAFWDLLPTFADFAGIAAPACDGISLLPLLTGKGAQREHDYLYFEFHEEGGKQAVRRGDWKLVRLDASSPDGGTWELYNLADDPAESHDLASERPEVVAALRALMEEAHTPDEAWPLLHGEVGLKNKNR